MRFVTAVVVALLAPAALAAHSVINILPAPYRAWGLEYHDDFLWVGDDFDGYIYKIDPSDGSVLDIISTPYDENHISSGANHGVTWDGTGFWVAGDYGKDWLYKVDATGSPLDTIPAPTAAVGGLSWDGARLVVTSYHPDGSAGILKVDPVGGSILGSIPTQGTQPFGVAYVPGEDAAWNTMDDNDGDPELVWHLRYTDGVPIENFSSPGPSPKGVAIGGGYMWLIANEVGGYDRRIYQIDPAGGGNGEITVIPAEHDFGIIALGSPESATQTVRNDGDATLTISDIATVAPFFHDPVALPHAIAPNETLEFLVTFHPEVAGSYAGILAIESDDVDEPLVTIQLRGTAVPPEPTLVVIPEALHFPDTGIGFVSALEMRVANRGYQTLVVLGIESDDPAFLLPDLTFPIALATFDTLTVQVTFKPIVVGGHGGTITISSNDPDDPLASVDAAGHGIHAAFEPGEPVWSAQGIENVVTVLPIPDVTGDGIHDAVMESYDPGASGSPHIAFWGNSHGEGVRVWSTGTSGGWGDQCLGLIADLDDDGYAEILRGTAWGGRSVEVRGSENGELLWSFDTHVHGGGGWVYGVAALEDVSGDGLPEVIAAVGNDAKRLYCLSGADGAQRFTLQAPDGFLTTTTIEDVDSDGAPDVIAGDGGNSDDDRVFCVSGASEGPATVIWEYHTGGSVWSVDVIDDVSGDGLDDVLAGSWSNKVFCLSGVDGAIIWERPVGAQVIRVEAMADVTGDAKEDVVVASLANRIVLLDGASGDFHWTHPTSPDGNVWSVSSMPDVNGDGWADVIGGSQDTHVYCVSGADGGLIWSQGLGALVLSVRSIEDVTGNGSADVLAGTQMLDGQGGRIWCLEGGGAPAVPIQTTAEAAERGARLVGPALNPMPGEGLFLIEAGDAAGEEVVLNVFDPSGRLVRSLATRLGAGLNRLHWDGRDGSGALVPSGVYLYRLAGRRMDEADEITRSGKLTLIR